jgi:hypothetical protein
MLYKGATKIDGAPPVGSPIGAYLDGQIPSVLGGAGSPSPVIYNGTAMMGKDWVIHDTMPFIPSSLNGKIMNIGNMGLLSTPPTPTPIPLPYTLWVAAYTTEAPSVAVFSSESYYVDALSSEVNYQIPSMISGTYYLYATVNAGAYPTRKTPVLNDFRGEYSDGKLATTYFNGAKWTLLPAYGGGPAAISTPEVIMLGNGEDKNSVDFSIEAKRTIP